MKKSLTIRLLLFLPFILIFASGFDIFTAFNPFYNQIKLEVEKELSKNFGREVSIGGVFGDLYTSLTFTDIKVARGKTLSSGSVITAKEMEVYYNPIKIGRSLDIVAAIYKIKLIEPQVEVIRNEKGEINLATLLAPPSPGEKPLPFYPKIEIENGTCSYTDQRGFGSKPLKSGFQSYFKNLSGTVDLSRINFVYLNARGDNQKSQVAVFGFVNTQTFDYKFSFNIKDLETSGWGNYVLDLPRFSFLGGKTDMEITVKDAPKSEFPFELSGNINLKNTDLLLLGYYFTQTSGKIAFNKQRITFRAVKSALNEIPLKLSGKIFDLASPKFDLLVQAEDSDLKKILSFAPNTETLDLKGSGHISARILGSAFEPKIYGNLEITRGNFYGNLIKGKTEFKYENHQLNLNVFDLACAGGTITGSGNLNLRGKIPSLSARANINYINLHDLSQKTPGIFGLAQGSISAKGNLHNLALEGKLDLRKCSVFGQPLTRAAINLNRKEGKLYLSKFEVFGPGSNFAASGILSAQMKFGLTAACRGYKFSNDEFIGKISGNIADFNGNISGTINQKFLESPIKNLNLDGKITLSNLLIRHQQLEQVKGSFSLRKGVLEVSNSFLKENDSVLSFSGKIGPGVESDFKVVGNRAELTDLTFLKELLPPQLWPLSGRIDLEIGVMGKIPGEQKLETADYASLLKIALSCEAWDGSAGEQKIDHAFFQGTLENNEILISKSQLKTPGSNILLQGKISLENQLDLNLSGKLDLLEARMFTYPYGKILGRLDIKKGELKGPLNGPSLSFDLLGKNVRYNNIIIDEIEGPVSYSKNILKFPRAFAIRQDQDEYKIEGNINFRKLTPDLDLQVSTENGGLKSSAGIGEMLLAELAAKGVLNPVSQSVNISPRDLKIKNLSDFKQKDDEILLYAEPARQKGFLQFWEQILQEVINLRELTVSRLKISAGGRLKGKLEIKGPVTSLQSRLDCQIRQGKWNDYTFDEVKVLGSMLGRTFIFQNLELKDQEGELKFQGNINPRDINFNLKISRLPLKFLAVFYPAAKNFSGSFDLSASGAGATTSPTVEGKFKLIQGDLGLIRIQEAWGNLAYENNILKLKNLTILAGGFKASLSEGIIPFDSKSEIKLNLTLADKNIGLLASIFKDVDWQQGGGKLNLDISGKLTAPVFSGNLKVQDAALNIKPLDSDLKKLNLDLDINRNLIKINFLNCERHKLFREFFGNLTREITNPVEIAGTIDCRRVSNQGSLFLNLKMKATHLHLEKPGLISAAAAVRNFSIQGPWPVYKNSGPWFTLSADLDLNDTTVFLPQLGDQSHSARLPGINLNLNLKLDKNVYLIQGNTEEFIKIDLGELGKNITNLNMQLNSPQLEVRGNLAEPIIFGKVKIGSGTVSILNRDFTLVSEAKQRNLFGVNIEKESFNQAVFSGLTGPEGILPKLDLLVETETQEIKEETVTEYLILSHITGIPFVRDETRGLKLDFSAYKKDSAEKPAKYLPSSLSQNEIKVLLLPDYIKGPLGLNQDSPQQIDTNTIMVDYLNSRLQAVLLRKFERQIERALGLENLQLEYNFGKDIEKATGLERKREIPTLSEKEQTHYGVGFAKGFFNRLFIDIRYKKAFEEAAVENNTSLNYQISLKLTSALSLNYYREPVTFAEQQSTYHKTTLGYLIQW